MLVEHEPIMQSTVEAAMHRYHTDSDSPENGRLTILNYQEMGRERQFGYWGKVERCNCLLKLTLSVEDQILCQQIVYQLDDAETKSDDDQPIARHKGNDVYPADRYDRATGRY